MDHWSPIQDLVKAVFTCVSGIVILSLGWFVGQKFTYKWNVRQKHRELQLSAVQQFYVAYGEFFAVWKLWNRLDYSSAEKDARKWELHKRAAAAEAIIEGILVKLASELALGDEGIGDLGRFRQAFQQLRQSIRMEEPLPWPNSESPEYVTFKTLAVRVSALLGTEWPDCRPTSQLAADQLLAITSNRWEKSWVALSHGTVAPTSFRRE